MCSKRRFKIVFLSFIVLLISIMFSGCEKSEKNNLTEPIVHERGEIKNVQSVNNISVEEIQQLLASIELAIPFTLSHSIEAISVTYYTIDGNGIE
ncbi:MAG: hypothetical protein K8S23_02510 [Candidatus Cloacimonetes bacterium]|nr:hypothetical protein [Candidatus Cloacimonadota bacterium]